MNQTPSAFKLGLFMLGGATLVLVGLLAFGLRHGLEEKREFETYVTGSVGGVVAGTPVKLRGVNVGEVTRLDFSWNEYPQGNPSCVVVHFAVRASELPRSFDLALGLAIQRGLRAIVEVQGITGVAFLSLTEVDPAENPPLQVSWTPHDTVIPSAPSQLDQILRSVQKALAGLQRVDFAGLGARLGVLIDTANGSLDRLDAQRLSGTLRANAARLGYASAEVGALAKDARAAVRRLQLEPVIGDASGLIASLQDTNTRLQRLIDRLADVDSRDLHQTLNGLQETVRGLNEAITKLQDYPSGFLFGEAPPRAQSVERSR
jgi:ABC-type transporter Mla subunit MlaD